MKPKIRFDINKIKEPYFFDNSLNSDKFLIPWEIRPKESFIFEGSIKISEDIKFKRYTIGIPVAGYKLKDLLSNIKNHLEIPKLAEEYFLNRSSSENILWFGAQEFNDKVFYKLYLENHYIRRSADGVLAFDFYKEFVRKKTYTLHASATYAEIIKKFNESINFNQEQFLTSFLSGLLKNQKNRYISVTGNKRNSVLIPIGNTQTININSYETFKDLKTLFQIHNHQHLVDNFLQNKAINFYYPSYIQMGKENNSCFSSIYYRFKNFV